MRGRRRRSSSRKREDGEDGWVRCLDWRNLWVDGVASLGGGEDRSVERVGGSLCEEEGDLGW